ncbi:MAG TPA: hypothetical protein VLB73_04730 [Patescibacteria group bacterium]|nr:hypothetical protein [Patescibacteria group bacterium]
MDDSTNPKSEVQNLNPSNRGVQPAAQPQPVVPVSGGVKEAPLIPTQPREWVSPSTPEVILPKEVQAAGVEVLPVTQSIPPSAQQAGVVHAKEATPVTPVAAQLGLQTPRSVLDNLKNVHKNVKDSFSWLIRLVIKEQEKEKNHPTDSRYN